MISLAPGLVALLVADFASVGNAIPTGIIPRVFEFHTAAPHNMSAPGIFPRTPNDTVIFNNTRQSDVGDDGPIQFIRGLFSARNHQNTGVKNTTMITVVQTDPFRPRPRVRGGRVPDVR